MSIKEIVQSISYGIFRLLPVNRKRVLLFSYYGEQYSGSPKYIGKYLAEHTDLNVVWAFCIPEKHREFSGKYVRYGHLKLYYHLATAGTVITNYRMTEDFRRRPEQKYIQTWHSSLRLKMIEDDAVETLPPHYVAMAKRDSTQITHLLAGCGKSREIFERAFWYDGPIVSTGTPQCDVLFEDRELYIKKVQDYYHLPQDCRIALYAPTFRKNGNLDIYQMDFSAVLASLEKAFGGKWVIMLRLHPHLSQKADFIEYTDRILQATDYDDVQELLCAADALISDYSAIMFDFAVTKRPCFLYTPDLEEYVSQDRNLYFDMDELPFTKAMSQDELLSNIENHSAEQYGEQMKAFLEAIGSYDDGKASERVSRLIMEAHE